MLHEDAAAMGRDVQVGIVKDLFQFHPYRWYNVLDHLVAWLCDKLFNRVGCGYGVVWCVVRCGMVWRSMVRCGMGWCGAV